ncbi:MAG TPA: HEAT repeat domain-containing protein, partial [Nitrospira sp.]|nr:HEAT repeat domain-containing protein [Nitrospira sp.]
MKFIIVLMAVGSLVLLGDASWARREALTNEQKTQMERIDRVLIDVLALSDQGPVDARPLVEVVAHRMKEFGYAPVTDPAQPHDVDLKIKC